MSEALPINRNSLPLRPLPDPPLLKEIVKKQRSRINPSYIHPTSYESFQMTGGAIAPILREKIVTSVEKKDYADYRL